MDFSSASVLVVGDAMLDRYWNGACTRVSPEAPVPVVHVAEKSDRAGGAGNVVLNVLSLGARGHLVAARGNDADGEDLKATLEAQGCDCLWQVVEDARTITKLRVLSGHQQLLRMDFEDGFEGIDQQALLDSVDKVLASGCGAMVISDYHKGTLTDVAALIALAKQNDVKVLVDPKGQDFSLYKGATVMTPNRAEFEAVVGRCEDHDALQSKGMDLLKNLELEALLITLSEEGMLLLRHDAEPLWLPTQAREVFDVTGAGDTVIGVLASALAAGRVWEDAVYLANTAAGLVVAKKGAATVSALELEMALAEGAVLDQRQAFEVVQAAKRQKLRVVMTNGCFDLLHAGHVDYLARARALGDRLIVAVNDDDSVRRMGKGEDSGQSRPVNALEQRMAVLAALQSVDWVVPFSEDTPERLICELMPDVLVKGGDYRVEEIAGGDCVSRAGGEVQVLSFVEGCSSSQMIDTIRSW